MAEVGIDRVTAKRIAGHVTDKMWDKYSQVRIDITAGPGSVYGISALRSRVEQSTINTKNPEGDGYPLWLFGVMMIAHVSSGAVLRTWHRADAHKVE
jgi:hypothetical protein